MDSSQWINLVIAVTVPILSAAIAWGVAKTKINGLREDVRKLENSKYITREEYESRHKELSDTVRSFAALK